MTAFTITPRAHRFIRMMVLADGGPGAGMRIAVSPGGCSGLNAELAVLKEPMPRDSIVEKDGLKLFLPAESRLLLEGVTIDFQDTASQTGLVLRSSNPTGCGH